MKSIAPISQEQAKQIFGEGKPLASIPMPPPYRTRTGSHLEFELFLYNNKLYVLVVAPNQDKKLPYVDSDGYAIMKSILHCEVSLDSAKEFFGDQVSFIEMNMN